MRLVIVSFVFIFFRSTDFFSAIIFISKIFSDLHLLLTSKEHLLILFVSCIFLFYSEIIYEITKYKNPKNIF